MSNCSLLTRSLLEKDPEGYYDILVDLIRSRRWKKPLRQLLNDRSDYNTWYASHVTCLAHLVGQKALHPSLMSSSSKHYYGANTTIPEMFGIQLLEAMVSAGADLTLTDYYNEDIMDILLQNQRTRNNQFRRRLYELYERKK